MFGFKLIGLDMSGTLSDDSDLVYEVRKQITPIEMVNLSKEDWMRQTTPSYMLLDQTKKEEFISDFEQTYVKLLSERPILQAHALPGIVSAVKTLSNVTKLFVVSSLPEQILLQDLCRYGIMQYITCGIYSSLDKPSAITKAITHAQNQSTDLISKDQIGYVGDAMGDIMSAQKVGIVPIAVCGGYNTRDQLETMKPEGGVFNNFVDFVESYLGRYN